ncbi:MAG: LLM class F420-dependent oxidoreductase [Thermodesulfobacteriota bacterium]
MKVGLFLPVVGGRDAGGLREFLTAAARAADEAGFHSLWFPEHVVLFDEFESKYPYSADGKLPVPGGIGMVEPFTAISFAAAVTSRIRLGTGVCLVPQRAPIYTAKQVADCDVLSGGRVDFGVGIGWLREEFHALGVEFEGRATRTREYLAAMKSLWADDVSQHQGHLLRIPPLRMFPKPVQKPHPPIVFGGHSDRALRRVADLGDGWFAFDLLPDEARPRIEELSAVLSRRGRRPDSIEVSVSPYLKGARDAASLRAYADAGVDQVIHMVFSPTADGVVDEIRQLAAELLPAAADIAPRRRPHH